MAVFEADSRNLWLDSRNAKMPWGLQGEKYAIVFGDPPFNIGQQYDGFEDRFTDDEYVEFTLQWILSGWGMVNEGGILAVHGDRKLAKYFWKAAIACGIDDYFENEIVWHFRFGQCGRTDFIGTHCNCLIFRKPGERIFNADSVLVDSDRASKYNDKRISEYENGGKRVPGTVWGIPSDGPYWGRVTGNSKERVKAAPNQLPLRYMQRMVMAYSNEGDEVCDLFAGTGTLGLVCKHEGRLFTGFDVNERAVEVATDRIENGFYRRRDG